MTQQFTDESFAAEVLESATPVMVDFTAVWCGPCQRLAPVIEELSNSYQGRVKIGKLDIDDNRDTAQQYGVMSVPTMLFFKGGQMVDTLMGAVPKAQITQKLDALLK